MSFTTTNVSSSFADLTLSSNRKIALKNCLEDVTVLEEESHDNIETIHKTKEILSQVETVYNEVGTSHHHLGESYLDSQVLCATSFLAIRCAESASGNLNKYDKHELAHDIAVNPDYWEFKLPYEVAPVAYLYGTFAPTPVELRPKAPRKKVEREAAGALKVPNNIANKDKTTGSIEMVDKVHKFLTIACANGPLSYFRVALDPTSFSKSVENIYYLSFLARNGLLELFIDNQTGLPFIKTHPANKNNKGNMENQFIISINIKLWEELVIALNIQEPMMSIEPN